jgi:hypothetical protein
MFAVFQLLDCFPSRQASLFSLLSTFFTIVLQRVRTLWICREYTHTEPVSLRCFTREDRPSGTERARSGQKRLQQSTHACSPLICAACCSSICWWFCTGMPGTCTSLGGLATGAEAEAENVAQTFFAYSRTGTHARRQELPSWKKNRSRATASDGLGALAEPAGKGGGAQDDQLTACELAAASSSKSVYGGWRGLHGTPVSGPGWREQPISQAR